MDELPDRLREAAGDDPVIGTVDIGGGDALVVTPARTHLYRSEGLLSDESVESFHHDVTRLAVETGRRKCSLQLESVDGERGFTVPARVADAVVEAVLEGILRTTGVVDPDETVEAQFRFSDLTLVVTDTTLFKHVGPSVWNEDFEMFDYESLTDLAFEEGSVATQVVLGVGGRQHRVKVPNEQAGRVRREVQSAVFDYHGVSSLGGLRDAVVVDPDETVEAQFRFSDLTLVVTDTTLFKHVGPSVWNEDFEMFDYESLTDLAFEEGSVATQVVLGVGGRQHRVKVPNEQAGRVRREVQSAVFDYHGVSSLGGLRDAVDVEGDETESGTEPDPDPGVTEPAAESTDSDALSGTDWSPPADQDVTGPRGGTGRDTSAEAGTSEAGSTAEATGDDAGDADPAVARLADRVDDLEAQLERQNELLEEQKAAIEQLVEELRRGR
jgi:hypothetical protein